MIYTVWAKQMLGHSQRSYIAAAADDNEPDREFFFDVDSEKVE